MNANDLLEPIATAVHHALERREAGREIEVSVDDITLERPKNRDHGDWSTNIAMRLAKRAGSNPREFAQEIADEMAEHPAVAKAEVAGPGFINFTLDAGAAGQLAKTIVEQGAEYGKSHSRDGIKINLEFVSANPTGPIHMGGVRWAAVGDSLARILEATGADVTREYYFNDHGAQIDRFARSLQAAHLGQPAPEDGYGGAYIAEIARDVVAKYEGDIDTLSPEEQQETFRKIGVGLMFDEIKQKLHDFGVDFDVYFHEDSIHESGAVARSIEILRERGYVYEKDGATWLKTTPFGDDKDRVIIRSDGEPTYLSGDIGYYLNKRERGFDQCLIMLGADHHGYIGRMMAMCGAFGDKPYYNLELLIGQMVNLVKDGEPVRMSKRAGNIVTMDDLVDAVGADAGRYAIVRASANTTLAIDLDLLAKNTNENPVYYVQYAHARTCNVARKAQEAGITGEQFDPATLTHETESALLGALQEFPGLVEYAADQREPHRIARYLEEISGLYHRWYDNCRIVPRDGEEVEAVHHSRRVLNDAASQVLRNGLGLVGVAAPERM